MTWRNEDIKSWKNARDRNEYSCIAKKIDAKGLNDLTQREDRTKVLGVKILLKILVKIFEEQRKIR